MFKKKKQSTAPKAQAKSSVKTPALKKQADLPIKSTSNEAKKIIRGEITHYFSPSFKGEGKSALDNMQRAANSYSEGRGKSDAGKGAALVDAGCFAVEDQDKMLSKIYGKAKVSTWDMQKRHEAYSGLIGREYAAMLKEREEEKRKKAEVKVKSDMLKAKQKGINVIKPGTEIETDEGIYHLCINAETGKYKVLLQPFEEWKGQRLRSNKNWRTVKDGSLRECSALIEKAKKESTPNSTKKK